LAARSGLTQKPKVKGARLACRLQPQPLAEQLAEPAVALVDRLAEPKSSFGRKREPPQSLIEGVDLEPALGGVQRGAGVTSAKARSADLLE